MQTQKKHQCEKCSSPNVESFFDLKARDIDGKEVQMSRFKDRRAILVVNLASLCDTTKQNVEGLNSIYSQYRDKGLQILGFPCNQFSNQQPGSNEEIRKIWKNAGMSLYPVFEKCDVNGPNAHPIWRFLRCHSQLCKKEGQCETIVWNFGKFLLDGSGKVVKYFEPGKDLESIRKSIDKIFSQNPQKQGLPLGQSKQQTTSGKMGTIGSQKAQQGKLGTIKGKQQKQSTENLPSGMQSK